MKRVTRLTLISAALLLAGGSVQAEFRYRAHVPGLTGPQQAAQSALSLGSAQVPQAQVGVPYSYDFKPLLSVVNAQVPDVQWATTSVLPAGLMLTASGVLVGTPSAAQAAAPLVVTASIGGVSTSQTYDLSVVAPADLAAQDSSLSFTGAGHTYTFANRSLANGANALPSAGVAFTGGAVTNKGCAGDFTLTYQISGLSWQMGFMGVTLLDSANVPVIPNMSGIYTTVGTKYAGLVSTNFFKPAGEAHQRYLAGQTTSYNWASLSDVSVSVTRTGTSVTSYMGAPSTYQSVGNLSNVSGVVRPALFFKDSGAAVTVTVKNWTFSCPGGFQ